MPPPSELELLLDALARDAMVIRRVSLPAAEVVYFKGVLEAYPSLASVHAPAGKGSATGVTAELFVATTPSLAEELEAVLAGLASEVPMSVQPFVHGGAA